MNKTRIFFIWGYFGWYNLGDDAIGFHLLRELSTKFPDAEFNIMAKRLYFLSKNKNPCKTNRIKFSLVSMLRAIIKSDEMIIAGGTHFQDEGKDTFAIFKVFLLFIILTTFAKILKKPVILLGHGIGPITHNWVKVLLEMIFWGTKTIIVRDRDSYDFVTSMKFKGKVFLGFDIAAPLADRITSLNNSHNSKVIGVSLLPFFNIYQNDKNKDKIIVSEFVKFLRKNLEKEENIKYRFFAFRSGTRHSDEHILREITNNLTEFSKRIEIVIYSGDIYEFLVKFKECTAIIGMRYHASLFAYIFKKPQILIDYQQKCGSLAKDILLPKCSILSLENVNAVILFDKVEDMLINPINYTAKFSIINAINLTKESFNHI